MKQLILPNIEFERPFTLDRIKIVLKQAGFDLNKVVKKYMTPSKNFTVYEQEK
jgi:hypothetical protein